MNIIAEVKNKVVFLKSKIKLKDILRQRVITLQTLTSLKCLASKGVKVKFAMNPNIPTTAKNPPINVGGRLSTSSI